MFAGKDSVAEFVAVIHLWSDATEVYKEETVSTEPWEGKSNESKPKVEQGYFQ